MKGKKKELLGIIIEIENVNHQIKTEEDLKENVFKTEEYGTVQQLGDGRTALTE